MSAAAMSVQSWFNNIWYRRARPPWWLIPLSVAYGAASRLRRRAYATFRQPAPLLRPVIVVGNLSVGGTGKTPLVCWLVAQLAERGLKPGVVTRGYGGSSRGTRRVEPTDDPHVVGDESILLARRTFVPVAAGRDRRAASQLLIDAGCNIIVSDDGLQHYALARDCEIVVIDADRRLGNRRLLPAGPLRESPARLRGVDAIVLNGGGNDNSGVPNVGIVLPTAPMRMRLEASFAIQLKHRTSRALREFAGHSVHAIAAIGNPQRFFDMLRSRAIDVMPHPLPDHAHLRTEDIFFADDRPVLMTEKDAVKCADIAGPQHWYVPVRAVFSADEAAALLDIVMKSIQRRAVAA
jgi:tetraacyldisaccharide 4'-kinase